MSTKDGRRHSVADEASIVGDPLSRAELESANAVRQFDLGMRIAEEILARGEPLRLRPSLLLALHREALRDISTLAGTWRPAGIKIEGSGHQPPGAHLVPELVEQLCDYVNERWSTASPIHLAAYVMWRLNWIHPFTDGNGRTSRITSYIVLCIALRSVLRGRNTIPDQIVENRRPYFDALEAADAADTRGAVELGRMEDLLEAMLAVQLKSMIEVAANKTF